MSNSSFLEYLYETHKEQLQKPSDYIALLVHSIFLDKKCKLANGKAVLPDNWNQTDPIRLSYQTKEGVEVNVSVVETGGDVFVSATESAHDRLGSVELVADDHVNTSAGEGLKEAYPELESLSRRLEEDVWQPLFPVPPPPTVSKSELGREERFMTHPGPYRSPLVEPGWSGLERHPGEYGRVDMDPFGLGSHPLGLGPGSRGGIPLGGGGMLFDPRRDMPHSSPYPGAPPLAGPPGARIDPMFPGGPFPGNRGRGRGRPDPDMPHPPGWEDMYL